MPSTGVGVTSAYTLAALTQSLPATVLTLEGGIVGVQTVLHFTPLQLQGSFCRSPNTCQPVDYLALPGDQFIERGADEVLQALKALPGSGPVILVGHSEGGQVIDSVLRRWKANPAIAPDPARLSWVSLGNPDNAYGGQQLQFGAPRKRPADTPYTGIEVIRQYDGWADWPSNPFNALAVANAIAGSQTVHPNYFNVDVNSPKNVRYTPKLADGTPGKITYVWVPNPVLPLVAGLGPLAPVFDRMLRPLVEAGYNRPVRLPTPGAAVQPAGQQPLAAATRTTVQPTPAAIEPGRQTVRPSASIAVPVEPAASTIGTVTPGDVPASSGDSDASSTASSDTPVRPRAPRRSTPRSSSAVLGANSEQGSAAATPGDAITTAVDDGATLTSVPKSTPTSVPKSTPTSVPKSAATSVPKSTLDSAPKSAPKSTAGADGGTDSDADGGSDGSNSGEAG